MKITIVTPQDSANFGAFLQAYCLKYQLEKLGHDITHIYTRDEKYVQDLYYKNKPISKKEKLIRWKFKKIQNFGKEKRKLFLNDQQFFCVKDLSEIESDLYILGSDEIWNINQSAFRKEVFWGIGMFPVMSYAASIGNAELKDFEKYPEQINAIRQLGAVLVRDKRTKEFVEKYSSVQGKIVCDPTMLIPVDQYGIELEDEYIRNNSCLLIYAYSLRKNEIKSIKEYAKKNNLKTVSCCFYHDWCDYQCMCSPLQFSSLIRQCKAVITTTFHGSIFSILNHADFVSVPTSQKTNQLLEQFELSDRLIERNQFSSNAIQSVLAKKINYESIEAKIELIRKDSIVALEQGIFDTLTLRQFDYQICRSDDCTGCFACMNKCPKQAIRVVVDKVGRTLPLIDHTVCVKCGACKKVCPVLNPVDLYEPIVCYAAQRPDESERKKSASGGIGAVLTESFIKQGGIVCGAVVSENVSVEQRCAESLEEGNAFRGSKYVQSHTGMIYKRILAELKNEKKVLFTGTPCQIAGLRKFLGKEYENLYCVDIICHGVPPRQYLKQHLENEIKMGKIDSFSFRGGDRDFMLKVRSGNNVVYNKFKDEDAYYKAFWIGATYRENCYKCYYANQKRCGDITIGDFWGINRSTLITPQKGRISAIIVNTAKGEKCIASIRDKLIIEERQYAEAVDGNLQLRMPSKKDINRDDFIRAYLKYGKFDEAIMFTNIHKQIHDYIRSQTIPARAVRKLRRKILGRR